MKIGIFLKFQRGILNNIESYFLLRIFIKIYIFGEFLNICIKYFLKGGVGEGVEVIVCFNIGDQLNFFIFYNCFL